jgi:hypothetical protein
MMQAAKLDSVLVERATNAIFAYVEKRKNGDGGQKIALIDGAAKGIITQVRFNAARLLGALHRIMRCLSARLFASRSLHCML